MIDDDWDDVDGVVHVKKAIAVPHDRRVDVPVSALMTAPLVVPETIRLDQVEEAFAKMHRGEVLRSVVEL